jgi:Toastrack DUF4097
MRTIGVWLRSRGARLTASVALGLGLLTLGLTAFGLLSLTLPAGAKDKDQYEDDEGDDRSSRGVVRGESFHWAGRLSAGRTLEIRGINGGIEAEPSSDRQARVDAQKSARRSDPDRVKVEATETRDGVLICARYPRPDGSLNDCDDRHGQETRNNDTVVKFHIEVPAGVRLVTRTVNGGIQIVGVKGDVEATTVNGAIQVATSGNASATTVNGSVTARIGSDLDDDLEFTTVNGRVLVEMPRNVNADVRGSTVHGSILSDFPLAVRGRNFNRRIEGRLGRGGHEMRLSTVNGSIQLRTLDGSRTRRTVIDSDDDDGEEDDD